jgi:hypothetical protein
MNLLPSQTPTSTGRMRYRHDLVLGMAENIGFSLACIAIMSDTLSSENFDRHYNCLEMVPINWSPSDAGDPGSDNGIVLEVWRTGGLVHSCLPMPKDSLIELVPGGRIIQAQVSSCKPDEHYGFIVQVSVDPDHHDNWFPESYSPA